MFAESSVVFFFFSSRRRHTRLTCDWSSDVCSSDLSSSLTYEQFRFGFANAVSEEEAHELYNTFAVPASGTPLFQAATANLNPWTEAKVKSKADDRGPLLIISGENDNTVPWSIANASYKKQSRNKANVTEITEMKGRGHALVIDHGWREVADTALQFVQRFVQP